jgi:hypothetical protein
MALQISTPLNTSIGVTIPTSYARIGVNDNIQGTSLVSTISIFATKEAFEAGADPLPVVVGERFITSGMTIDYNRELDGADILQLAHEAWIAYLGTLGITAEEDLSVSL